jgi:cysteine desulfurase
MYIYADNASTTIPSENVISEMSRVMRDVYGNPSSIHSAGEKALDELERARELIAEALRCEKNEIVFTSGGSESDNQAILSSAYIGNKRGKKHIISTEVEHHAVLNTLNSLKEYGYDITLVGVDENGIVNPSEIERAIRDDTALVSVMYANNEIGTIQPIEEIGEICRKHGVKFHTDAVQAFAHIPISLKNVDMLSVSAHKFHGPRGVGFLYVNKNTELVPLINGGGQEKGRRAGTENLPGIVGMAEAVRESMENLEEKNKSIIQKRDRIISELKKIPHSVLNGDEKRRLPGNINMCFEGIDGEALILMLDLHGIQASSGSACNSGSLDPSGVLLALGREPEIARGSLRLSLGDDLNDDGAEYIIKTVTETVEYLRRKSPLWQDKINGKRSFLL